MGRIPAARDRRAAIAVGLIVILAGCSSSATPHRASPVNAGHPVSPPAPPAAVALAHRLLDDAVLPPGVKRYAGSAPLARF